MEEKKRKLLSAESASKHVRSAESDATGDHLVAHADRYGSNLVLPGDAIPAEPGTLRGHGTLLRKSDGALVATVAGVVERVSKLVSVRPLRARYHGEVGDVVVARVVEVGQKRWRADVGARQDAVLMLSSIVLPSGEQRRRTAEDQLNMRQFYVEGDLLSAEVQAFFHDGGMSLHTRSMKYGKLRNGVLVRAAPSLMKRLKQHFFYFDFGVRAIFGMNGFVWLEPAAVGASDVETDELNDIAANRRASITPAGGEEAPAAAAPPPQITRGERERVCRARNSVVALDALCIAISPTTVAAVYKASLREGLEAKEMVIPKHMLTICAGQMAGSGGASGGEADSPK